MSLLLIALFVGSTLISLGSMFWGGNTELESVFTVLETSMGTIELELDSKKAPITVANFVEYVQEGHYDGTIFHRVIPGFMIQGGGFTPQGVQKDTKDPIILESDNGLKNNRGTIAMANAGPNTGSSQFYINLVDNNRLDDKHPVFGKVVEGMSVVDRIGKVETDENDKPLQDVIVIRAELLPYS